MQVTRNKNGSRAVRIGASYSETNQRTNPVNKMEFIEHHGGVTADRTLRRKNAAAAR